MSMKFDALSMDEMEANLTHPVIENGLVTNRVIEAIELAEHLLGLDRGVVALALEQARAVDLATALGDPDQVHRAATVAMPSLLKTLTNLGLTPEGRMKLGLAAGEDEDDW